MRILSVLAILFAAFFAAGQNSSPVGQFNIRNFDSKDYVGSPQNWDIVQNSDHLLYFANNSGILEFNGETWTRFDMPNSRHPRSLFKSSDGTVYVGGIGCFGVLDYNEVGKPVCRDISKEVSAVKFDDIWKIHELDDKIAFVSFSHIFLYDTAQKKIDTVAAPSGAQMKESASIGGNLFVSLEKGDEKTIGILDGNGIRPISEQSIAPVEILSLQGRTVLFDKTGQLFYVNEKGGNFKLEKRAEIIGEDSEMKINDVAISDELVAVCASGRGVYLYDHDLRLVRVLQEKDGLENLEVRKAYFDQYKNLWLCNDNGISFVEMSSAITWFDKKMGVTGITEDIFIDEKVVSLATHSDLFQADFTNNGNAVFENKRIFGMDVFQIRRFVFSDSTSRTLVILNEGIVQIDEKLEVSPAISEVYAWDMYQSVSDPDHILIGLDGGGLGSARYLNGEFIFEGPYKNTSGEVRSVAELNGKIYYSVAFEGVYLLDTTRSQEENLLPGLVQHAGESKEYKQFDMAVFDGKIFVGTSHGMYTVENDKLVPFKELNSTFFGSDLLVHRTIDVNDGKLWIVLFRGEKAADEVAEVGYLSRTEKGYEWFISPLRPLAEDVIYSVTRQSGGYYWFGGGSKVFVYNADYKTHHDIPFSALLTQIEVEPDSLYLFQPKYASATSHQFDYAHNSITFRFASTAFLGGLKNEYSYFLEGEDTSWSKWTSEGEAEYQRLGEGTYTFRVKARNYYGFESTEATFVFTILPPWYRTVWAYIGFILLAVLFIYVIIKISIRRVKRQNERLEEIVEERTAEIAAKNQQLEHQKAEIEEKSNDILDSIKYAKRIQNTILPDDEKLKKAFDFDHFVLYRPKDIVSGDFYWAQRFEDKTIFSAIDCTGHGVPGAFVSIVGHNGLNRAVNEFKLRKPSEILDKLADLVIANFSQTHSQIKDGMDIALCSLDNRTLKLEYAGANNPLIIVRKGEIIEIKANKQPIGEFATRVPFDNHEIQLQKGDCVYIFSDGYADQFGGEKGKKLKLKNLKSFLEEYHHLEMKAQHQELNFRLEKWMTGFEQLDDICIFGVKI